MLVGDTDEYGHVSPDSIDLLGIDRFVRVHDLRLNTLCLGKGDESKLDPRSRVEVCGTNLHSECSQESNCGSILAGTTTGVSYVLRKCWCNFHNSLCNRHCVSPPPTLRGFMHAYDFLEHIQPLIAASYNDHRAHLEVGWWDRWSMKKRKDIKESLDHDPICYDKVKSFVKREGAHKRPTKARAIQGYRNLATQASTAMEIAGLQKAYSTLLQNYPYQGHEITFASGLNSVELGKWMDRQVLLGRTYAYERDGKNWDSTMQEIHQCLKLYAYRPAGTRLQSAIQAARNVRGSSTYKDAVVRYNVADTTKSGHNDTTLGNSIVNASIALEAATVMGIKVSIIVAGDDLLVMSDRPIDGVLFSDIERQFGITPEYSCFDNIYDVTFVSGLWCPTAVGHHFIPKPGRLLKRLFWTCKPLTNKTEDAWRHAVVSGLRPTCINLPVIGSFLKSNDRVPTKPLPEHLSKELDYRGRMYAPKGMTPVVYDEVTNEWFRDRYKLSRKQVLELEAYLTECGQGKGLMIHHLLEQISDIDNCEVDERIKYDS